MNYNSKNPIPKWLVKGRTVAFKDGNIVSFAGKNKDHFCIIIKDEKDRFHVNFTIRENEYEAHTKDERTGKMTSFLDVYSPVITDLVNHWKKERPDLIKEFTPKYWKNHDEYVIDMNSDEIPGFRWLEGLLDIEPNILVNRAIPKENVIKLKFSMGLVFKKSGYCVGMLLPHKKAKKLVIADRELLSNVLNTAIGIDKLKDSILEEYANYKKSENDTKMENLNSQKV